MAKQTSGQASQSQKTSESQKTAKKTAKKTEHVLEQTPKSLLIGTGMTLLGGAMWGMNSTVAKLLMRDYQLDPIWLSCVRALFASLIFLVGSAITTPQKLAGAVKDVKSYPKYLVTTLICVLLVQVSYLMTIDWTNSGTATVLQTLNLIFVLAWVCLRGKRLPLKRELVGVLLAFAGTFLIATGGNFASLSLPWQGLAWGLVDAVSTAAMSILPVVLMLKWGNMTINGITFLMSGLILCPFAQPWANIPGTGRARRASAALRHRMRYIPCVLALHGRRDARRRGACHHARAPASRSWPPSPQWPGPAKRSPSPT